MIDKKERSVLGDVFDRTVRGLDGMPEVVKTKATTVRSLTHVLELSQTFIVQTYRRKDHGDTVLVEYIGKDGSIRLALPPEVTEVIARQRDALISRVRSTQAKLAAADRKARGIAPGFMKKK